MKDGQSLITDLGLRKTEKFPEVYVIPPQHFQFP